MNLRCIVIDDERSAIELLKQYISDTPGLSFFKAYKNPLDALAEISKLDKIDVIFMDINMPYLTGLDLAKAIRDKTHFLIFTTAHKQYTLEAFDLHANQYLLKPIPFSKFALEMDKLIKAHGSNLNSSSGSAPKKDFVYCKGEHKNDFIPVKLEDIIYIKALGNYSKIFTRNKELTTYCNLKELDDQLKDSEFIRINRSVIVAKNAISRVAGHQVIVDEALLFDIGTNYKTTFFRYITDNALKTSQ